MREDAHHVGGVLTPGRCLGLAGQSREVKLLQGLPCRVSAVRDGDGKEWAG